jgi:hypothetical protein
MQKQLALFDISDIAPKAKPGDWIKLRRKSKNAAYLKKGDIVQVETVHPLDGSIRFWNDRTESWGYLYPDEIIPVPLQTAEPVVGELSRVPLQTAEPVVGELSRVPLQTAESVVGEIPELNAESVVGEISDLNAEPVVGEITKLNAESVVGEIPKLNAESVVGEIPKLNAEPVVGEISEVTYSGNGWIENHYKIRRGGKQHSIKCPEIGCTGPYSSYRWMEGKRQRARYCPASKCPAVRKALGIGQPVNEILKIINQ